MDVLHYYIDETAPAIRRSLSLQDSGDVDIVAGPIFYLRVRPQWSSTVAIDAQMTADVDTDELVYQPVTGDFDTEGIYRAWIYVNYGAGLQQSTDEFQINVFAHAPGEGTRIGAVWRAARALEPVSWDSLRNYPDYGDVELQRVIELSKLRVLASATPVGDEESLDPRIVDFIAKKVLSDNVLYAAISFWSDQVIQQSARGNTDEVKTYPDRIRAAEEAIKRYREDLERQAGEVAEILGSVAGAYDAPALLGGTDVPLLTPGLDEYPAQSISEPYYYPAWRYRR